MVFLLCCLKCSVILIISPTLIKTREKWDQGSRTASCKCEARVSILNIMWSLDHSQKQTPSIELVVVSDSAMCSPQTVKKIKEKHKINN